MKKCLMCALLALLLVTATAHAEGGLISALATSTPEPSPTPAPTGLELESDGLRLTLPSGFEALDEEALETYDAAAGSDYPDAAQTILAAADAERGAMLIIAAVDSQQDCLEAAREAADALLGNPDEAAEETYGDNRAGVFACAIGEQAFRLHYISDGQRLYIIGTTGLEPEEIAEMLIGFQL